MPCGSPHARRAAVSMRHMEDVASHLCPWQLPSWPAAPPAAALQPRPCSSRLHAAAGASELAPALSAGNARAQWGLCSRLQLTFLPAAGRKQALPWALLLCHGAWPRGLHSPSAAVACKFEFKHQKSTPRWLVGWATSTSANHLQRVLRSVLCFRISYQGGEASTNVRATVIVHTYCRKPARARM